MASTWQGTTDGVSEQRAAMRDSIYTQLLAIVVSGKIPAGNRLSVDTLARQLQVSPTPVREALLQLEATGLVNHVALKGFCVAHPIGREEIEELFDARLIIELGAIERAYPEREKFLPSLRQRHAEHMRIAGELLSESDQASVTDRPEFIRYFDADWAFHQTIIQGTGNRFLADMASRTSTHVIRLRQSVSHGSDDISQAVSEHGRILAELSNGSLESVVAAMSEHITAVHARAVRDV